MSIAEENKVLDLKALHADRKRLFVLYADLETDCSKAWLVDRMLGAGELSAFYGPPGCGKGVIIEDMGLHIAAGLEWHGKPVTRGAVLYVALERRKLVERRAIAFRVKHGLQDLPFAIAGGVYDFRNPTTAAQILDICREVERQTGERVVLIIVDTVSRALAGGDENSPKDMGALVTVTARIQESTKAHVLLVHHIPHDAERMRGHGALLGAVDTTVAVVNAGSVRTAKVVKANDGEEGEGISFTVEGVEIAPDGTTAAVAVPADIPATSTEKKWAKGLRLVRDCIDAALTEAAIEHSVGGDGPIVRAVSLEAVRNIHKARYVSSGDGERSEAERKAWTRNFKAAQQAPLIGGEVKDGAEIIWLL
ncbi:AAA domain-containing protein [Bradyrhizobium huanghuaihaiense]|uniref:AAA domain-containing protein n=1 Tax=Bradyrhizobium huanghuaihaiense TaxID=990078 RepID=A0A562RZ71_9BRAD|nr:AAA family ATPase [Bradyrhizobium huanghuaihaiense]TWI73794.1 AAA domain-containing protein [Bradyrhizobium huanghuaihaiense]